MTRSAVLLCILALVAVATANLAADRNSILRGLGVKPTGPKTAGSIFWPVADLAEEDEKGLPGMQYDTTMPLAPAKNFTGMRIGFVVSHCYEEIELTLPYHYFALYGAVVEILAPWWVPGQVRMGAILLSPVKLWAARTRTFSEALEVEYDGIVVPGGVWSSTVVRNDADAIKLINQQYKKGKMLSTTCAGSTILINAGLAKDMPLTGSPSIAIDLINAGAEYQDVPTVTTGNLVTGRSPGGKDNQLWISAMAQYLNTH